MSAIHSIPNRDAIKLVDPLDLFVIGIMIADFADEDEPDVFSYEVYGYAFS